MTCDAIATDKLAATVGPFSLGVRGAGLLFLSGQVAQDPATGKLIDPAGTVIGVAALPLVAAVEMDVVVG